MAMRDTAKHLNRQQSTTEQYTDTQNQMLTADAILHLKNFYKLTPQQNFWKQQLW